MELKEKVRKVIMEHLRTKGFPNLNSRQVLNELKPMWIKLEEAGLIQPGWKFARYAEIAQLAALRGEYINHFKRRPR